VFEPEGAGVGDALDDEVPRVLERGQAVGKGWGRQGVARAGRAAAEILVRPLAEPRHVHVERDDCRAKVWLDPVRLHDSAGFRAPELRQIESLVGQHADELRKAWDDHFTD